MKTPKLFAMLSMAVTVTISNAETAELNEVMVTANKMEQSIKEIPASISVISDIDMEDKDIQNVTDVIKQIPNLSETNAGYQKAINFRGVNQSLFTSTNPVVIYSDGVPQNTVFEYDVMLENAERIEVLRGPQGTLYGKDAIGGVINVISKEPDNEWKGRVGLEYGSNNYMQGSLNANGALINDKLFLNFGVLADKSDSWIINDYDGSDANAFKEVKTTASLTFKPNNKMKAKLTLGSNKLKSNFINGGISQMPGQFINRKDAEHANYDLPAFTDKKSFSQALNVDYEFDSFTFSSLTTHKNINIEGFYDADMSYDQANANLMNGVYMFQNLELDSLSQEFKISSDKSERFKWVAGVYYDKEDNHYKSMGYQFPYVDQGSGTFFGIFEQDVPSRNKAESKAVFAQGSYDVNEKVNLTLGGRYQKINKTVDLTSYMYPTALGKAGSVATSSRNEEASWNAFLPKLAIKYNVDKNTSIYASYTKGYLPGGFNYFPTSPTDNLKFNAQTSDNFEVGMRGTLLNGKLDLGASIFYMDIDDIHLYDTGYDVNNIFYSAVSNGGKAKSKGIELDTTYRINDSWTINGAFGFTDAKYTQHTNAAFSHNLVRATPKYTANVGVGYIHPQGFYARLDVNAQGSIYFDDANTLKQKAWVTGDVKVGYMNKDLNIYGYVKNITDESHLENFRIKENYFNDPRNFGIGMKYSF